MVYQNEQGIRRLVVELPVNVHTRFKTEVSRLGLDLRGVIIHLIESWLSGNSKIKIQPAVSNPEKSIEEIVEEILEKRLDKYLSMKKPETESAAGSVDVHNVAEPVEVEEPEEIPEEIEEPVEVEEVENKPKKKVKKGIWPWVREVEVEEAKEEESGKP